MAAFDRDKALDLAVSQIERAHGKGSVMRLGDRPQVPMSVIPTGSIALDVALGIGGLPRGRVVEIYGPEASGKCLTADSYLWTDRGLETIGELFARCGQPATCTSRVTDVRDLGVRVVNERGELEQVAALTHNNRRPVRRITLRSGRAVTVTHNHPLRIINDRGFVVWRRAGELQPGDFVVSAEFGAVEAASGDGLSEDEAVLLGYLVAEGTLTYASAVRFTNWDAEVGAEFRGLVERLFDLPVVCYYGKEYAVSGKAFRTLLAERYGLAYVAAAGKSVPPCVRTSGHKAQRAFLSALFEGDGWIDASSTIGLGTASEQLAREVQLLLYGLGIPASLRATFNQHYQRNSWSVTINAAVAERFVQEVGFRSTRRNEQVARNLNAQVGSEPQVENLPNLAKLLRDLRDDLGGDPSSAHVTYEDIRAIDDLEPQPTFDIALADTHSFLANGMLSHNTTVALHAVANAQAAGGIAAFIDAEHALDPDYAKALGVDTDGLLVSQPDTGEQALEIADMLIRSGALDVIVIDSVAALVPRAEIEGEMGDSHVGLQARLMSQALRKLTGALNNSGTTAIFINQLREKVGVMFGSPETTSGGRALKFYASIRLDVRRIETLKDGTEAVGNRTRVKVVKNKCLAADTAIFDPVTGQTHRIQDVVDQRLPVHVVAAAKDGTLHVRPVMAWFDQGEQDVIDLRLADQATLRLTADHQVLTDRGWRTAGELAPGDRVARPRRFLGFGSDRPISEEQARLLGSHIGDSLPPYSFAPQVSSDVVANLIFGLFETDGWVSYEQTGALRVGFTTSSRQLAQQLHWQLLRFGIGSSVRGYDPRSQRSHLIGSRRVQSRRPMWEVRVAGTDNVALFAQSIPTWGPRGQVLTAALLRQTGRRRGSQRVYLPVAQRTPVLEHLRHRGVSAAEAATLIGSLAGDPRGGLRQVLGVQRLRRDRLQRLADALDDPFLHEVLAEELAYSAVRSVSPAGRARTYDLEVEELHTLVAEDVVVHNCAAPFKQAEFDIVYGQGISREGSLIDMGVEQGIVRKSGAWYTYEGDQLGQGKENARAFLRDNPDLGAEIEKRIKEKLGIGAVLDADQPAPAPVDF